MKGTFLLGNWHRRLYWFNTEGVKKTKMREARWSREPREIGPLREIFRTNHPKVASDLFPSLAKEGSFGALRAACPAPGTVG
jgi:hypothetical protein